MPSWSTETLLNHPNFGKLVLKPSARRAEKPLALANVQGRADSLSNENNSQSSDPVLERYLSDGTLGASQVKKRDTRRFLVRVTSFRRRLLDEDNLCEKFHVDCCRYAGLIPTDAASQTKIETGQVKVKSEADERTEIEILNYDPPT